MRYEYVRLQFDFGNLSQMNSLSGDRWKVIAVLPISAETSYSNKQMGGWYALLERPLPEKLG